MPEQNKEKQLVPKPNNEDSGIDLMWLTVLIGFVIVFGGIAYYATFTFNTDELTNVTVAEKYPYTYRADGTKIVDDEGKIYYFTNERLWAKLKIGETYEVRVVTKPIDNRRYINAAHIGDLWYY
jgi:hypothetical protein